MDPVFSDPLPARPAATNMEVTFKSSGARLPGYLMLAGGAGPHPTALLLHGYPGNEKNLDLALTLRRVGCLMQVCSRDQGRHLVVRWKGVEMRPDRAAMNAVTCWRGRFFSVKAR